MRAHTSTETRGTPSPRGHAGGLNSIFRTTVVYACFLLFPNSDAFACDRDLANAWEQKARDAGGNFESKAQYFRNAINECPKTPKTYADLSDALLHLEKADQAESVIEQGVDVDPKHSEVRRVYGDVLLQQGKLALALAQYERALEYAKIPRDRFYALANKGWVHHAFDDHTESTKSWTEALNIDIVFDPVTNRRLYNMVAWNHAVCRTPEVCDGAVAVGFYQRNPAKNPAWNEIGTGAAAYARQGRFATAIRLQEKSISSIQSTDIPNKGKWLEGARERMKLYQRGMPYSEN